MAVDIDAVARDLCEGHSVTAPGVTLDPALDGTGGDCSRFVVREISFLYYGLLLLLCLLSEASISPRTV